MLELTNDVAADWFLQLWAMVPTPAKAKRIRGSTIAQLLKRHRIRRLDVEIVLCTLRQPAIKVAAGVAEAACVHLRSLAARLRLVNRELRNAECKLDEVCAAFGEQQSPPGQSDVAILKSLPGIGRINLATLLAEASGPLSRRDYSALRTLSGVAPVTKRSGKSHTVVMRRAAHNRLRNTVYHWARSAIQHDQKSRSRTWPCASVAIPTAALFAASPTDYSTSLAPFYGARPCSIPTTVRRPQHEMRTCLATGARAIASKDAQVHL
jgi:transposase